ncbi:MAG: IS3 family transposase [Candidatus Izemoplasmatales bacterium]|jgi:transposase InsO family protein|nr:IS3 family transposase [Candidatus Izemoplasmatales bacterium]
MDVLEIIKKEELTEPTVLHTNQGSVYSTIPYNELIKDYMHYYNNERCSYALKYKTPVAFKYQLGFH